MWSAWASHDVPVPPGGLVADDLGAQPVVFVVARDMEIPKLVDLEYLSRLSWVINQDGCGLRDTLKRRFDGPTCRSMSRWRRSIASSACPW